jgi:nitroreductase
MEILEGIYSRRSVRHYTDQPVERDQILEIIKAGSWAPSGLNNQPWRYAVATDKTVRGEMAKMTKYGRILEEAPAAIAVLIDKKAMYNDVKDHQSIGACLENMLLAVHAMGLGAVWLGEILKNAGKVRELFELPGNLELMAVVAVGHPAKMGQVSTRMEIGEMLLKEL